MMHFGRMAFQLNGGAPTKRNFTAPFYGLPPDGISPRDYTVQG